MKRPEAGNKPGCVLLVRKSLYFGSDNFGRLSFAPQPSLSVHGPTL